MDAEVFADYWVALGNLILALGGYPTALFECSIVLYTLNSLQTEKVMGRVTQSNASSASYDEARTRKVNAEAEMAEIELEKLRGAVVVAEDVVAAWEDVLGAAKAKFLSIPTKAAPVVASETDPGVCQKILEELMREALDEFSNYNPQVDPTTVAKAASEESVADDAAPAKPKRKRVGRPRKAAGLAK